MFPDDSAVVSWINWGDETAQRDQDQGVGRNQGSINPNFHPGVYCGHCRGGSIQAINWNGQSYSPGFLKRTFNVCRAMLHMLYETAVSPTIWFAALCESGRCINSTKYLVDMLSNVKKKRRGNYNVPSCCCRGQISFTDFVSVTKNDSLARR